MYTYIASYFHEELCTSLRSLIVFVDELTDVLSELKSWISDTLCHLLEHISSEEFKGISNVSKWGSLGDCNK